MLMALTAAVSFPISGKGTLRKRKDKKNEKERKSVSNIPDIY